MNGFTFLELIIVVAILGIVAALASPLLVSSLDYARLYGAASEVATAINYARTKAANSASLTRFTVDVDAETVVLEEAVAEKLADILDPSMSEIDQDDIELDFSNEPMEHPLQPGRDYIVDFSSDSRFGGADIVAVTGASTVSFGPEGMPSAAISITIAVGNHTALIGVDPLTGKVTTTL